MVKDVRGDTARWNIGHIAKGSSTLWEFITCFWEAFHSPSTALFFFFFFFRFDFIPDNYQRFLIVHGSVSYCVFLLFFHFVRRNNNNGVHSTKALYHRLRSTGDRKMEWVWSSSLCQRTVGSSLFFGLASGWVFIIFTFAIIVLIELIDRDHFIRLTDYINISIDRSSTFASMHTMRWNTITPHCGNWVTDQPIDWFHH